MEEKEKNIMDDIYKLDLLKFHKKNFKVNRKKIKPHYL